MPGAKDPCAEGCLQPSNEKVSSPRKTGAKYLNRYFIKQDTQMANSTRKSANVIITQEIKTTTTTHLLEQLKLGRLTIPGVGEDVEGWSAHHC